MLTLHEGCVDGRRRSTSWAASFKLRGVLWRQPQAQWQAQRQKQWQLRKGMGSRAAANVLHINTLPLPCCPSETATQTVLRAGGKY